MIGSRQVLVCFALKEESVPFQRLVQNTELVRAVIVGVGTKNATRSIVQALATGRPRLVLTCGYAGALNPEIEHGTVIFDADPNEDLSNLLLRSGAQRATFYCSERILVTRTDKLVARQRTAADAVEMESAPIRKHCQSLGIPSATVRVISDTADEDLPMDFNEILDDTMTPCATKVIRKLLKKPSCLPALLELRRKNHLAARNLAKVLDNVLRNLEPII